jgi:hypothetical protein
MRDAQLLAPGVLDDRFGLVVLIARNEGCAPMANAVFRLYLFAQ